MTTHIRPLLAAVLFTCLCTYSSLVAQTVLINFTSASTSSPDVNGNYWTNIAQGNTTVNLVDATTGLDSGYDYTKVSLQNTDFKTTSGGPTDDNPALGDLGIGTSTSSSFFVPGNSGNTFTCTFSNLDSGKQYEFIFFGSRQSFGAPAEDRISKYQLVGATTESTTLQTSGVGTGLVDGRNVSNVATISGISPNGSGVITFTLTTDNATQGYINAIEITAIPESSICAAALGFAVFSYVSYRRRRR